MSVAPGESSSASKDGRVLRGLQNRRAIIEAVYVLVQRLGRLPEVDEVAVEAGVGARTVFRQFSDLDRLWESINDRIMHDLVDLAGSEEPTGVLVTDVNNVVACRSRLFEHMRPFRQAVRLQQARRGASSWLAGLEELTNMMFRSALERRLGPFTNDPVAFDALDMVMSFESWERLRVSQGLSVAQSSEVMRHLCFRLLTP